MKKLIYIIAIVFLIPVFTGCEDFLDTNNYTSKDSQSFPKTPEDAAQMLTGVYAQFNQMGPGADYIFIAEFACDDRFGGGGENDKSWHAVSRLMYSNPDEFSGFWNQRYRGISRANACVDALENADDFNGRLQKLGEAKFLRANWYFELVQLLGNVPLMASVPQTVAEAKESPPQASQEEIFRQIATDLWEAYSDMPSDKYDKYPDGTITKWAAAGLLARVYLFYTGFYNQTDLPREGGTVTKAQVVAALEDLMTNSGHDLLPDFRQLWPYSNTATMPDYPFVADMKAKGLAWIEGSGNTETIFVTKFTNVGQWDPGGLVNYSNQMPTCYGIRGQSSEDNCFPLTEGWGAAPVNTKLWEQWIVDEPDDIRRVASIYNIDDEAIGEYEWGGDAQMEDTGLWSKKLNATGAYKDDGTVLKSFSSHPDFLNSPRNDYQLEHAFDIIRIRFADILLMHSELTETATGINRVRARAGLGPVSWSLDALKKERRYELAFEGSRWGDIRRWGIAEQELNSGIGVAINNVGVWTTMKEQSPGGPAKRYRDTNGFYNIPRRELDLSNGAYQQNAGWDTPDANFIQYVD